MIGAVNLKAAHQGNKHEIMEIEDYARSLGFLIFLVLNLNLKALQVN